MLDLLVHTQHQHTTAPQRALDVLHGMAEHGNGTPTAWYKGWCIWVYGMVLLSTWYANSM